MSRVGVNVGCLKCDGGRITEIRRRLQLLRQSIVAS
jgi:hypothetical protein